MNIPNLLSILRMILVIPLLYSALTNQKTLFLIIFIIGGLTDILDGAIARKFKKTTELGSKLDSIADYIFFPIGIFSLIFFSPEIILDNLILMIITGISALTLILIKLISKRFLTPHHYLSKISSTAIYILIIYTIIFDYNKIITNVLLGIVIIAIIKNYQLFFK